ncbi:hypothetical protein ACF061_19675 [Streptomyces sp. NPDC015220]|uniref:hypothetical protein n=1 Tax=Streptomyces sp. NPDC015220 TaxID=3364947 RepID=UPI0036FD086B
MTDTAASGIPSPAQVTLPDGRVQLAPGAPPPAGPYADADPLPVPSSRPAPGRRGDGLRPARDRRPRPGRGGPGDRGLPQGATNGTRFNDRVLKPGSRTRLHDGDRSELGPRAGFVVRGIQEEDRAAEYGPDQP